MIQPSALPAASALLPGLDPQAALPGETTGAAATTAQFADFLAKRQGLGPIEPEAEAPAPAEPAPPASPVAALRAALARALGAADSAASGREPGKPGGKDLPDLPEAGAEVSLTRGEDPVPDDATASTANNAAAAPGVVALAPAQVAATNPQDASGPVLREANTLAAALPVAPHVRQGPFSNNAAAMAARKHVDQEHPIVPADPAALPQAEPDRQPQSVQAGPAIVTATADRLVPPAIALRTLAQLSEALAKAPPAAAPPVAMAPPTPIAGELALAAAKPAALPDAAFAESLPGQAPLAGLAFAGQAARLKSANQAGESGPSEATTASPETTPSPSGKAPAPETASLASAAPPLAALNPADPQAAAPAAPATTAPATAAAPQPRDIATLIDRLIEAREAAQSTLAPQAVQAALAHAEFGKVSLQFQHDAGGMTVMMASADPDFSRAVQAASPGGQTANDTGAQQRQDTSGQSSANASFTQSQSQQRGQSAARDSADPRPADNPSPRQRDGDEPSARSGIFA